MAYVKLVSDDSDLFELQFEEGAVRREVLREVAALNTDEEVYTPLYESFTGSWIVEEERPADTVARIVIVAQVVVGRVFIERMPAFVGNGVYIAEEHLG